MVAAEAANQRIHWYFGFEMNNLSFRCPDNSLVDFMNFFWKQSLIGQRTECLNDSNVIANPIKLVVPLKILSGERSTPSSVLMGFPPSFQMYDHGLRKFDHLR